LTDISLRSRHAEPSCRPSHLTELAPVGPPKARHPRASIPRHPTPPGTATRVRPRHPTPPPSTLLRTPHPTSHAAREGSGPELCQKARSTFFQTRGPLVFPRETGVRESGQVDLRELFRPDTRRCRPYSASPERR